MRLSYSIASVAIAAALAGAAPVMAAVPVDGAWLTENGRALVKIGRCGNVRCGKLIKVLVAGGSKQAAKRRKAMEGTVLLTHFVDRGSYWAIKTYDPRSGWTVDGKITGNANGSITLRACAFYILCGGETWNRAPRR